LPSKEEEEEEEEEEATGVCVFPQFPSRKVVFPFHQRLFASSPVISKTVSPHHHGGLALRDGRLAFICANQSPKANSGVVQ